MSIRDELVGGTATACKLCAFLSGLSPRDSDEWRDALAEDVETVGNGSVVAALKRRGVEVHERSVRRHRRNHG